MRIAGDRFETVLALPLKTADQFVKLSFLAMTGTPICNLPPREMRRRLRQPTFSRRSSARNKRNRSRTPRAYAKQATQTVVPHFSSNAESDTYRKSNNGGEFVAGAQAELFF
jgi:hypothetical protein